MSWLWTSGVNTNGAAAKVMIIDRLGKKYTAKVMNFDRLGEKVRPGTFGKIKLA